MNRIAKVLTGILCGAIVLFDACTKDNKSEELSTEEILKTESLETVYGCQNTMMLLSLPDIAGKDSFYIINNQKDFDAHIKSTSCSPQIDFDKYTLLIGTKILTSGCSGINYELKKITAGQKESLSMTVRFELNLTTVAIGVTYHVLMPRQQEGIPVNVHLETK